LGVTVSQLRVHQSIAGYMFEGPYRGLERFPSESGLYAVISSDGKEYYLLDVGYSVNVKKSCQVNPRRTCWEQYRRGELQYSFLRDSQFSEEMYGLALKEIRKRYRGIPCGKAAE
jgi:hypothetical protein